MSAGMGGNGWIKLHRSFDQSEAAHFPPCTREVWFYLLRNVNYADSGKFKRGSGFFSLEDIQEALAWTVGYRVERYSKPQLTKALRRLREGLMIETAKETRGVTITILNYDKYQGGICNEGNGEGNAKETRRYALKTRMKNEEETTLRKSANESSRFDEFWNVYPRKKNKVDAQKAWKQAKGDSLFDEIMTGLQRATTSLDWAKEGGQFIPYPASWLRAGGWMDEARTAVQDEEQAKTCKNCRHNHQGACPKPGKICDAWAGESEWVQ